MIVAEVLWGLACPLGKVILAGGISPMLLTDCRMAGAALLFWLLTPFTKAEKVSRRDLAAMFLASLFGIVLNQCCFMWGLNLTSPVNASIITTALPIITMVMAALILREPVTRLKLGGVFLGAVGALILIAGSSADSASGASWGDILVLMSQLCFTCYLIFFKNIITRYSPVTLMKWMFTFAALCTVPFSYPEWLHMDWSAVEPVVLWGVVAYVVGPTFLSYLVLPVGQRYLRPTVTAMYNYVQPVVASFVAVWAGISDFTASNALAVVFVFTGVFLVTQSKSRADMERLAAK